MWNPSNSTMLQVLVSIQALVLNSKPYFNEPGYAMHANTSQGEKQSMAYNEETFAILQNNALLSSESTKGMEMHDLFVFLLAI